MLLSNAGLLGVVGHRLEVIGRDAPVVVTTGATVLGWCPANIRACAPSLHEERVRRCRAWRCTRDAIRIRGRERGSGGRSNDIRRCEREAPARP